MKKNFVSNSSESVRMFKNGFLESLSKVHFTVPLLIYIPVVIFFGVTAFKNDTGILSFAGLFLLGLLVWTITEYLLHRFVFHFVPGSQWGLRLHFIFHGVHHDYPRDAKRLVMPPSASIPLAIGFYFLFKLIFRSNSQLFSFFPGFIAGYLIYDMTHYALHHYNFKSGFWKKIKQHHMLHHYEDSTKGYGVSSSIWDLILKSDFPKKKRLKEQSYSSGQFYTIKDILITGVISIAYLSLSYVLIGYKPEQLVLIVLFNTLYYISPTTRKFILGFSIFIIYWIIFDYMKAFPNYLFSTVHIESLYQVEKDLFGIHVNGDLLTPNEYLLQHTSAGLDILTGLFYLCWVPLPLLFAGYLFFRNKEQFFCFSWTFLLTNIIGFIVYYCFPAAPPWYVQQYGFSFHSSIAGNTAGLERFDDYFGITVFKSLYERGSNVFAAMPSLHSSYPLLVLYYGIKNKMGWVNIVFTVITVGIWFAAVYTSHHYILDVIAGILCGFLGIVVFAFLFRWYKWYKQ